MKIELYKDYGFEAVFAWISQNDLFDGGQNGRFLIGEETWPIPKEEGGDPVATFLLTGYANEGVYTCVYLDPSFRQKEVVE